MSDKFSVVIEGFGSQERALAFLSWYEGGGEQAFWDHLIIIDEEPRSNGCSIDVKPEPGQTRYFRIEGNKIIARVK